MGIDVYLYAEVEKEPGKDELATLAKKYNQLTTLSDWDEMSTFEVDDHRSNPKVRVEVNTLSRYFSPYNNRGWWPEIYSGIRALQNCFPGSEIFYSGDTSDVGILVTEERLGEYWCCWLGLEPKEGKFDWQGESDGTDVHRPT